VKLFRWEIVFPRNARPDEILAEGLHSGAVTSTNSFYSERDCVKSLRSSYIELYPQRNWGLRFRDFGAECRNLSCTVGEKA